MPLFVSDMPLSFADDTSQEEIDCRRAERMARKKAKDKAKTGTSRVLIQKLGEKEFFPNLTGEFDEDSPFAKHFTRKHDE